MGRKPLIDSSQAVMSTAALNVVTVLINANRNPQGQSPTASSTAMRVSLALWRSRLSGWYSDEA